MTIMILTVAMDVLICVNSKLDGIVLEMLVILSLFAQKYVVMG